MANIPTSEPAFIQAGDTVKWQRTLPDYPASAGWVLAYRLINAAGKIDIPAAADGDAHLITVAAATSAGYAAGAYDWQAFVTLGAERYTVGAGRVVIRPNLAAQAAGFDARSTARKALDDLRAALAAWLTNSGTVQEYEIAGRRMKFRSMVEVKQLLDFWRVEESRAQRLINLAAGLPAGNRILTRMGG